MAHQVAPSRWSGQKPRTDELCVVPCQGNNGMSVLHRVVAMHQVDNWLPTCSRTHHKLVNVYVGMTVSVIE